MAHWRSFPHVVETQQFSRAWLESELFPLARKMQKDVSKRTVSPVLAGKGMATIFYEPSTRTRFSFEIAMQRLGGWVVSTENAKEFSSAIKGESIEDTFRVLNGYHLDVLILRHSETGAAKRAAAISTAAVINAGDGTGQHPTQALLDIFTIHSEFGKVSGTSVALVGDLAKGRTVRSLAYLLAKFEGIHLFFVSPPSLRMGRDIKDYLGRHDIPWREFTDLREVAGLVDVVYQTRTQTERGSSSKDMDGAFCTVNEEVLSRMPEHSIVMHPLPRNAEIDLVVDKDPRSAYFRQAENGLYVRMALLQMILG